MQLLRMLAQWQRHTAPARPFHSNVTDLHSARGLGRDVMPGQRVARVPTYVFLVLKAHLLNSFTFSWTQHEATHHLCVAEVQTEFNCDLGAHTDSWQPGEATKFPLRNLIHNHQYMRVACVACGCVAHLHWHTCKGIPGVTGKNYGAGDNRWHPVPHHISCRLMALIHIRLST